MQIYWIQAQAPRRVLALVKHLGIEAEFIEMDLMAGALRRPEYAAINPNMKVPTLVDGDYHLWESSAIMAYLCVKAGSDMWPADTREQIEVLRWLSWNDCHWAPAVAPYYFEHIVKSTFGIGPPDAGELAGKEKSLRPLCRGPRYPSARPRTGRLWPADHRRLPAGVDGGVLEGRRHADGTVSAHRGLARRPDAPAGVGRSLAGRTRRPRLIAPGPSSLLSWARPDRRVRRARPRRPHRASDEALSI